MGAFRRLEVCNKAHALALAVFRTSARFPQEHQFVLTNQLQKAILSIPSNIAEGSGRGSKREFIRFLRIALGSAAELEYQLFFAIELRLIRNKEPRF